MGAINRIAINRKYQNGTANGFCDLTEGFNITIIRENVNGKVNYDAEAHRDNYAIDPSWVVEQPDIVKYIEDPISEEILRKSITDKIVMDYDKKSGKVLINGNQIIEKNKNVLSWKLFNIK